ncbi:hypothetical protein A2773_07045 [Candidatus Gottesmanbacteria bacterium RIFCSPHIGHO2_01_FULL_39_10]|uniref:Uncharacterized protein n=1 Tax=Candidatus Gottesmanbacteria bacterium RIFCSPHIGHO2_01_FULL_39_10 TaxID=1798375 RepID=A0A1F5ZQU4_9BACT|nr:MAG: hypothetical protein A2773_07045 [Candidatus Gottesmanbacteria bacterium RIFCSPHIGHO2_01_FULL_39_10]
MKTGQTSIPSVGDILLKFNPLEDKYISREFQSYGYYLSEKLNDMKHKSLYMRLAKTLPRSILEKALSYCMDAKSSRKGALFMWKLKEMGAWNTSAKRKAESEKVKNKKQVEDIPF